MFKKPFVSKRKKSSLSRSDRRKLHFEPLEQRQLLSVAPAPLPLPTPDVAPCRRFSPR